MVLSIRFEVSIVVLPPYCSKTFAASTFLIWRTFVDQLKIVARERVPFGAMGLPSMEHIATSKIHALCYGFEVFWIDASPIAAKVIELHTFWNRPN